QTVRCAALLCGGQWGRGSLSVQAAYGTLIMTEGFSVGARVKRPRNKGTPMKKSLLALAAVATLAVSMASPAYAWRGGWGWGPGIGLGILGGAIVGGAIASQNPYYYGPGYAPGYYYGPGYAGGPYGPCYLQRQRFWDGYAGG